MESKEFKGKSVDEAIYNGLVAMGLSLDEVEIEVVQEGTKGFLGLGKSAVVRLTEREPMPVVIEPAPEKPRERREKRPSEGHSRPPRSEKRPRPQRAREERRPPDEKAPAEMLVREEAVAEAVEVEEAPKIVTPPVETPESQQAEEFLNGLFKVMGIDAHCAQEPGSEPLNLRFGIRGEDTAVLIGRRGDTLDALQYLTGLVVNKAHDEYIRVMLDAEGYREKREQTLEKLARRLASNVARSGRPVKLEPMNPYERRILHSTLQNHPKVETYSEGVDPYRRVIIRKKRSSGGPPRGGSQDRRGPRPRRPRPQDAE